jgi:pimeloyl-ACP methyl ester carboxylesterase
MRRYLLPILLVPVGLLGGLLAFDYLAPHKAARLVLQFERRRSGLREGHVPVAGFDIAYLEGGSGEVLLLIHGFGASKDNFVRIARFLTPRFRVLIPDLPGFGESSKPENMTYSIPEQVERLHAFVKQSGLSRIHLGGSSMGGFIAAAYAAKYPGEVASLWLLGSAGTRAGRDSEVRRHYQATGECLLLSKRPEDLSRVMQLVMSRPPFFPYCLKRVIGERAAANYSLHSRIFDQDYEQNSPLLDTYITNLAMPTLVVWGKEDRVVNPMGAETFKAMIPEARVILMDGIGHIPMIEATEQVAEDYLRFRNRLETGLTQGR